MNRFLYFYRFLCFCCKVLIIFNFFIQPSLLQANDDASLWQNGTHKADYRVFVGGIEVAHSQLRYTIDDKAYSTFTKIEGVGLLQSVLGIDGHNESTGILHHGEFQAKHYKANVQWRQSKINSTVTFKGNDSAEFTYSPEKSAFKPEEYDPHILKNTMNPASFALRLANTLLKTGKCDSQARLFTGRSRVDAESKDFGDVPLPESKYSTYQGVTRLCEVLFTKIRPTDKPKDTKPLKLQIYMITKPVHKIPYPALIEGTFNGINGKIWIDSYQFEPS